MEDEPYSIRLVDRKVRFACQIADVEAARKVTRTAVCPADAREGHPVAALGESAELRAEGRDVVVVPRPGPAGIDRKAAVQDVSRGGRDPAGDVIVVVGENGEDEVAAQAAGHVPALGHSAVGVEAADPAAEVFL